MTEDDPEDEPTAFELAEEARLDQALAASSEAARKVIEDCHEAFGYGIPTVVLGQVGRWYWEAATSQDHEKRSDARRAAGVLADLYTDGDESVRTVIATGFLEALPQPHEEGREVVERLPAPLREELQRMETWTPG